MIVDQLKKLAVAIDSLSFDAANARRHNKRNLDAIKASLAQFGQRKPIVVQREGMIVRAGNGTLEAAKELGWTEIAAVVIDEDGTTASQFAIADNRTAELAEWDEETLATLLDSMSQQERESIGFNEQDLDDLLKSLEEKVGEDIYTNKIKTPIYEITGKKPNISEMIDSSKKNKLIESINKSDVDGEIRDFLLSAAERHVVFRYDMIAEFYAHSDKKVQELMEESALVIIDFDKAIENGFVRLSKQAEEVMIDENEDA